MADDRGLVNHPIDQSDIDARRENRHRNLRAIGTLAIGLILLSIASIFMLHSLFRYFEMREKADQARPNESNIDADHLPPEPRLQDDAVHDLQQMRAAEDQTLNAYGWIDQQKHVVRIPIDRAIDLLAQRGLSGRATHGTPNNAGNVRIPADAGIEPQVQHPGGPQADQLATVTQANEGHKK